MNSIISAFKSAPGHLKFVSVLSIFNIAYSLIVNVTNFMKGPLSKSQVKQIKASVYEQASAAEEMGGDAADWLVETTDKLAKIVDYTNANFELNYISSILVLMVGLMGVFMMVQRKIVGFHLYIIYSLAAVGQVYLIAPAKDVPTFMIVTNLVISAIFVMMYSRHHKWMQNQPEEPTI